MFYVSLGIIIFGIILAFYLIYGMLDDDVLLGIFDEIFGESDHDLLLDIKDIFGERR